MIRNDKELNTSRLRIAYFQDLLMQLRITATPEEYIYVSSGYRMEIEKMQQEVLDYLTQNSGMTFQTDAIFGRYEDKRPILDSDNETKIFPVLSNAEEIAKSSNQEIINLKLNFVEGPKTQASISFLSNIFGNLQNLMNAIGMICYNSNRITEEIRNSMDISLLQVGSGSFEIQLASSDTEQIQLFDYSYRSDAIEKLFELLNAENNQDHLRKLFSPLRLRVAKNYNKFLESLVECVIDTEFRWTSPNSKRGGSAHLTRYQMEEMIDILKSYEEEAPSTFTIIGTLIGVVLRTKTFEISTKKKTYKGHITDEALDSARNATLSQEYIAEIQEITARSETTNEITKPKYQLSSLKLVTDEQYILNLYIGNHE